jgi:hypothetical protein
MDEKVDTTPTTEPALEIPVPAKLSKADRKRAEDQAARERARKRSGEDG